MIAYLPLLVAVALCGGVLLPAVSHRVNQFVTRVALLAFGDAVVRDADRRRRQRDWLRAAHVAGTHRVYASKTLLYAGVLGVAGSVIGVYAVGGLLSMLEIGEATLRGVLPEALSFLAGIARLSDIGVPQLFLLLTLASATVGSALAAGTYYGRWELLRQRAHTRSTEIDATLPRTVAFMYALSRSGMAFPRVMDTVAENEAVYGEAATELSIAVRDMNAFGTDALTALQRTSRRTPSDDLADFAENLASVLGTGQPISTFLSDQYDRYQEEAESKQEQYLELLSTFAEAYVTALVAGPLFFITILVVIGLVLQDTLPLLRVVVYVGLPLATFGFVVYVDSVAQGVGGTETGTVSEASDGESPRGGAALDRATDIQADGGTPTRAPSSEDGERLDDPPIDPWAASRERLRVYDRLRRVREWVASPIASVLAEPHTVVFIAVPIATVGFLAAVLPVSGGTAIEVVDQFDTPFVVATAAVLGAYAAVYEVSKRRVRRREAAVPDFLDRLASVNEAGTSIVGGLRRVADSNLEALSADVQRTRRDLDWGADAATALWRLERRVRSPMVSRAVTLIANAMYASGDIGPVLRIAAEEARATWSLRRERRQVMLTYLVVIYISFFVFLGIIASLSVSFIPAVESATVPSGGGTGAGLSGGQSGLVDGMGDIEAFAYEQLFFHAAAVQAVCSGLVAGQLGEGAVRDGVKHVVVLLAVTLVAFFAIGFA